MSVRLQPSFFRCAPAVAIEFILWIIVVFAWHLLGDHASGGIARAMAFTAIWLIPLPIFVIAVWFMFVPSELEFSSTELVVRSRMGRYQVLPWDGLRYYGHGNNVFMIEFEGMQTIQIFSFPHPRSEWRQLRSFLDIRYPHNKASLWLGPMERTARYLTIHFTSVCHPTVYCVDRCSGLAVADLVSR